MLAIALSGTDVYVGGKFSNAGGVAAADAVAKWNGISWSALGSNGLGDGAINGLVNALAVSGTDLCVGGNFSDVAGIAEADNLARWNGSTWSAVGLYNGTFDAEIHALAVSGSDLSVGGSFTDAAGISTADRIVRWTGTQWLPLGSNGAGGGALSGAVLVLAALGNGLFVGGSFTDAGGIATADYVASWDGSNWAGLGSDGAGNGALNGEVRALALSGTYLYVGGSFAIAGGFDIAKWNGAAWSALGSPGTNRTVSAIALSGTDVYVGGYFSDVGGVAAADNLAKWNGTAWSALGPHGPGDPAVGQFVTVVVAWSGALYVGGFFYDVAGIATADNVAKWALGGPRKPDGRIRLGTSGPLVGNNVHNATGAGQTRTGSAARGATITYGLSIQNDGPTFAERFSAKPAGVAMSQYTVKYFHGATDITAAVVQSGFLTPALPKRGTYLITVRVTVRSNAAAGSSVTRLLTVRSADDPSRKDAVKLVARRA